MHSGLLEFIRKSERSELYMSGDHPPPTDWSRLLPPFTVTQSWQIFWRFLAERHHQSKDLLRSRLRKLKNRISMSTRKQMPLQGDRHQPGSSRHMLRIRQMSRQSQDVRTVLHNMKLRHAQLKKRLKKQLRNLSDEMENESQQTLDHNIVRKYVKSLLREKERQLFVQSIVRIQRQSATVAVVHMDSSLRRTELVVGWPAFKSLFAQETLNSLVYPQSDLAEGTTWCHSCRAFKPTNETRTCSYRGKIGNNSSLGAFLNPYRHLYVMYKSDVNDSSHKFYYPYLQYKHEGDEEVCGRAYCKTCLISDTENTEESFVCPYCLGFCVCDRCALSDSIAKYQSQFIEAGGTFMELSEDSIIYCQLTQQYSKDVHTELEPVLVSNMQPVSGRIATSHNKMEELHFPETSESSTIPLRDFKQGVPIPTTVELIEEPLTNE